MGGIFPVTAALSFCVRSKHVTVLSTVCPNAFFDHRKADLIEHQLSELLAQRIHALALGYEDINDHDCLRLDPVHALLAGKKDLTGSRRLQ